MQYTLRGLHHVTATVSEAQPDLDFYSGLLGLRLVKKTVNFDNHNVYHFYYGTEKGAPGTIMTTFPYKHIGVKVGTKGTGQISHTSFSVPQGCIDNWQRRLGFFHVPFTYFERFGERGLAFVDPSGLNIELIESKDNRPPWTQSSIPQTCAIRGIHSLTIPIALPQKTIQFLSSLFNIHVIEQEGDRIRLGIDGGGAGKYLDILDAAGMPQGINGLGTIHHVALGVETAREQLLIRQAIIKAGIKITEVRDRKYFQSIYFREPGGVLLEIATLPPGFLIDEPITSLGKELKLPPWEEQNRKVIEQRLAPIHVPV